MGWLRLFGGAEREMGRIVEVVEHSAASVASHEFAAAARAAERKAVSTVERAAPATFHPPHATSSVHEHMPAMASHAPAAITPFEEGGLRKINSLDSVKENHWFKIKPKKAPKKPSVQIGVEELPQRVSYESFGSPLAPLRITDLHPVEGLAPVNLRAIKPIDSPRIHTDASHLGGVARTPGAGGAPPTHLPLHMSQETSALDTALVEGAATPHTSLPAMHTHAPHSAYNAADDERMWQRFIEEQKGKTPEEALGKR